MELAATIVLLKIEVRKRKSKSVELRVLTLLLCLCACSLANQQFLMYICTHGLVHAVIVTFIDLVSTSLC